MASDPIPFFKRYRIWILVAVIIIVAASIWRVYQAWPSMPFLADLDATSQAADPGVARNGGTLVEDEGQDLPVLLSEGRQQVETPQPVPVVYGEPLDESRIQAIQARLPELEVEPEDQVDFRLAPDPIPPPKPGETIAEPFPPVAEAIRPSTGDGGPLEVVRYSPEGEIGLAPLISVTFNQPMVALATLEDLGAASVPVTIEPDLPGAWRWLGTKTLTFAYESDLIDRLPKATEYTVTIPGGTRSVTGGVLAETVTWSFTTPPPQIVTKWPFDTPQPRSPLFFIAFDQRIIPAAVLETIRVNAGNRNYRLQLATEEEVEADKRVDQLVENAVEGRWLAFKTTGLLPADSQVTVTVAPGTPSAEGPLVTRQSQVYSFYTYAPLRVVEHGCWWSDMCRPLTPLLIRFNNPLDDAVFRDNMLSVSPEIPGMFINVTGDTLQIQGATQGNKTYTVVVSSEIRDVFGQKLGRDARLTFRIGRAEAALFGPERNFVTLDPIAARPVFSVFAINYNQLAVKIYAVQPADWPAYQTYLREQHRSDIAVEPPGSLVLDSSLPVEAASDTMAEVGIDLSPYTTEGFGHFVVQVSPPRNLLQQNEYWQTINTWVQVTQIGVDAFVDHSEMVVWVNDLKDGAPVVDASILAGGSRVVGGSASDGTARFAIPDGASFLVARKGSDQSLLPRSEYDWWGEGWRSVPPQDEIRWYVFDDRQMYRPGEEIHLKGWLRRIGGAQRGDVSLPGDAVTAIRYTILEPQGNEINSGRVEVNALGGFDFAFTIPQQVNLGYASVGFWAEGRVGNLLGMEYWHSFQVQEFRRPEFEVTARTETPGPYFAGEYAMAAVEAKYYAGDPLANADTTWNVRWSPGSYAPPNWPDFIFGEWKPWWFFSYEYERSDSFAPWDYDESTYATYTGLTDSTGTHYLRLDFPSGGKPRPVSVTAEATVMDVNRQAWTGSTNLLVHPAALYVGLRSERLFVQAGIPLKIELIVTDLDGNAVADRPIAVTAARMEWKFRSGEWREEAVDEQTCTVGSRDEPVSCTFDTPLGGTYRITAIVSDANGRRNQSQFERWVSGGQLRPTRNVEQESVTLIPDHESYQPGDTAQILVQSPFSPAEGLLTVSRSGILYTQRFQLVDGSATLEVPITEEHIPNLNVQVDIAGSAPRLDDVGEPMAGAPPRPAFATAQLNLPVPPLQRTLSIEVKPAEPELEPGAETNIDVVVRDAAGEPASGAEVALVVVDEAVLALSGYRITDPMNVFYYDRPSGLMSSYIRSSIVLASLQDLSNIQEKLLPRVEEPAAAMPEMDMAGPQAPMEVAATQTVEGRGGEQEAAAQMRVRTDFNPLAAFSPAVRTGADGSARVSLKLPDNLTRYRVVAVAVQDDHAFGLSEANLTARLPLMVRPSAPRFLNFGDRFELPVVLQNQTDEDMSVDVVIEATNLSLTGSPGVRVDVPARDRVEVRFPASADQAGTARLMIAGVSGDYVDAALVELPVYTPATSEAFATYGVIDSGAIAQPVGPVSGVFPQYGGLEIQTSSTALQALTDAILYLVEYPFECSEQIASRVLAIAALRDVLTAFQAEGLPSPAELEASVGRDIEMLRGLQNVDGGFPYWRRGEESAPFNSIHVAYALQMAQSKGFSVPADMKSALLDHLRQIENYYPGYYSADTRRTLSAYALFVRHTGGDRDPAKAQRLISEAGLEKLSLDAIGWLWPVLQDATGVQENLAAIRRLVNNRVVETAGAANFTTAYDDQNYLLLGSNRRTDAILLNSLMIDSPQHDLIPKVVNGLLAQRVRGRWGNTQENVFVLLALDRYFNTYESQAPDFVAQIWLGQDYVGGHEYRGRTTVRHETNVAMSFLVEDEGQRSLLLNKEGDGRLYYRLGLRYAPTDLRLEPLDMGFVVQRAYEAVDDPADVTRDADGAWQIKAGARVRVKVQMVAVNRRYHVALVDPLPAGLEIINPDLAVSGSIQPGAPEQSSYGWWWRWFQHQNLRDERAEAFATLLWEGVYEYSYLARATTPGTFIVPPARAEEMYSPEVFGRSGSDWVVVK
ncbi:MAG TPA: alpha-2-macroglobulin family protein [Levilinea sp.]|nr:alpha-2-macroglobulin family protein [Levilinea sp.]